MSAVTYDLDLEAGASYSVEFVYKDPNGTPIDLTGWAASAMIRKSAYESGAALVSVTPAIDGPAGKVTLALTAAQTRTAQDATVWALEIAHPSGEPVVRLAQGRVKVSPEVVR